MLFLLLLTAFLVTFTSATKIICDGNQTISMKANDVVYFESKDFLQNSILPPCSINFTRQATSNTLLRFDFRITFLDGNLYITDDGKKIYYNDPSSTTFYSTTASFLSLTILTENNHTYPDEFSSVQGYIILSNASGQECYLSGITPSYSFSNLEEIIHIYPQSIIPFKPLDRGFTCKWNFLGRIGYGFKVYFTRYSNVSRTYGESILITNSTGDVVTDIYTIQDKAYYNEDNNITITYSTGTISYGILAYITIVKKNPLVVPALCLYTPFALWTSIVGSFYPNNAYCELKHTIPKGHILNVEAGYIELSETCDTLEYHINNETSHKVAILPNLVFNLQAPKDQDMTVTYQFTSDGSVQGLGFALQFDLEICECAYKVPILCDHSNSLEIMQAKQFHCANLTCEFHLQNPDCLDQHVLVTIVYSNYDCVNDKYQVVSNDYTVIDGCNDDNETSGYQKTYIPPYSNSMLYFASGPLVNTGALNIYVTLYSSDISQNTILLTEELPIFSFFPGQYSSILKIELSKELIMKGDVIEVLCPDHSGFHDVLVYSDANFNEFSGNCQNFHGFFNESVFLFFTSNVNTNDVSIAVVRAKEAHSKNCLYENIVFFAEKKSNITMIANDQGYCEITIVMNDMNTIKSFWTNSKDAEVEVFTNIVKSQKLLSFSSQTAPSWEVVAFSSKIAIVRIPPLASIFIKIFDANDYPSTYSSPFYTISKPMKSLYECGSRGCQPSVTYRIQNISTTFTATSMATSSACIIHLKVDDGTVIDMSSVGQNTTFFSADVQLYVDVGACHNRKLSKDGDNGFSIVSIEAEIL